VAEDIITALSRFPDLVVVARSSSFTYKGRTVDVRQVGRELGVRYVLEGSVRKAGMRLRISARLVDCAQGFDLWSKTFDRELGDVFAIQEGIVLIADVAFLGAESDLFRQSGAKGVGACDDNAVVNATVLDATFNPIRVAPLRRCVNFFLNCGRDFYKARVKNTR